jgi:hypothetical protein
MRAVGKRANGKQDMKQAKHLSIGKITDLNIRIGDLGGYIVYEGCGRETSIYPQSAAFSTADECADYVRSHLKNVAALKFGAKKPAA